MIIVTQRGLWFQGSDKQQEENEVLFGFPSNTSLVRVKAKKKKRKVKEQKIVPSEYYKIVDLVSFAKGN